MMRVRHILLLLVGIALVQPSVFAQQTWDITTPGTGFVLDMDDLTGPPIAAGITVFKGETPAPDGMTDYFINGRVTISANDLLTIYPGQRLVFRDDDSGLEIRGRLNAQGDSIDSIVLTSVNDYLLDVVGVTQLAGWDHAFVSWTGVEQTGDSDWTNDLIPAERNYRVIIDRNVSTTTGNAIRVKLRGHSSSSTLLEAASIGIRSTTNFRNDPTQLKFNGGGSFAVIPAGGSVWSDWISFNFNEGTDYLIHLKVPANHYTTYLEETDIVHQYYKDTSDDDTLELEAVGYEVSSKLNWIEEIQVRVPTIWYVPLADRPDRVYFDRLEGIKETQFSRLNAAREWYWSSGYLYVYSGQDPASAYDEEGVEVGYLPFDTGGTFAEWDSEKEKVDEDIAADALTSDLETKQGIFQITGVTAVVGKAPWAGEWDTLEFNSLTGKSVLRYVTVKYSDIGIYCSNVNEGYLDIEKCTIENNYSGIFLTRSSPRISGSFSISHNKLKVLDNGQIQVSSGSGIFMQTNSEPLIRQNTFEANEGVAIVIKGIASSPLPKLGNLLDENPQENAGRNNFIIAYADPPTNQIRIGQRHIFNETPNTIFAHRNFWGTDDPDVIDSVFIYDDDENPSSGPVEFRSFLIDQSTGLSGEVWQAYR